MDFGYTEEQCREELRCSELGCLTHFNQNRSGCWMCQKANKQTRLKNITRFKWRLDKIREWTKISQREIYADLTLKEIEQYFSQRYKK